MATRDHSRRALETIVDTYLGVDADQIRTDHVALFDYLHVLALSLMGRYEERDRFFWGTAAKRLHDPEFKQKMLVLLEDERPEFADYRLWEG